MKFYRGVVEDNNHPEKNGLVKVRIFGIHTQFNENSQEEFETISTEQLPWAEVVKSTDFGLVSGVGISSILRQGTWVLVVLDNDDVNKPIIIGTISGKNSIDTTQQYQNGEGFCDPDGIYPIPSRTSESDLNRIARNESLDGEYYTNGDSTVYTKINDSLDSVSSNDGDSGADVSQDEPNALNDLTEYPNCSVVETQSGHVLEIDDTSGNERMRYYHPSGSYMEFRPDGSVIKKTTGGESIDHYIHMNDVNEHIAKGVKRYIEKNLEEIIDQSVMRNIKQNITEHIGGNLKLKVDGNLEWEIGGNITITSGGTQSVSNGGSHSVSAPTINLN